MAPPTAAADVAAPALVPQLDDLNEQQWYITKLKEKKVNLLDDAAVEVGHSGPQGKVVPLTIIDDPSDWKSKDLKPSDYTYELSEAEVAELIAATDALLATGVKDEEDVKKLTRDDFLSRLPTLAPKWRDLLDKEVTNGRGFLLVRNFPVEYYKNNRVGLVVSFYGLGLITGRIQISQTDRRPDGSIFGSTFNHITVGRYANVWNDPDKHSQRFYGKRPDAAALSFHSDQGATDMLALLCLTPAKEGGESKFVSAIAIHNELLRRGRKDLVEALASPGWLTAKQHDQSHHVRDANGDYADWEETQPFEYHDGYLSVHFSAQKFDNTAKGLTPLQEEAVWAVSQLAEDPDIHLQHKLQTGEIIILHNPSTFHARTEVVDGEGRHLVRWWVHSDANKRPIPPHYAPRSNVGPNGGFQVPNYDDLSKQRLPLYPYARHDGLGQSEVY